MSCKLNKFEVSQESQNDVTKQDTEQETVRETKQVTRVGLNARYINKEYIVVEGITTITRRFRVEQRGEDEMEIMMVNSPNFYCFTLPLGLKALKDTVVVGNFDDSMSFIYDSRDETVAVCQGHTILNVKQYVAWV